MKTLTIINHTQLDDPLCAKVTNKLRNQFQAEYDYNGAISSDEDPADFYVPLKGVRLA